MSRQRVPLAGNPSKVVLVDPDATEGAVVNENLFIRNADGSLSLFQPSSGTVTDSQGKQTTVVIQSGTASQSSAVGGSNSGYSPDQNPAAAPTNYDLDASMIAGLNNPQFPTLNYILVGNGTQWVAVPMTGDSNILAGGNTTDIYGRLSLNSRVNALMSQPTRIDWLAIHMFTSAFGS